MNKTATGFVIDPFNKTITEVTLPLVDDNVPIKEIYKHTDCELVDLAHIRSSHNPLHSFDLWIDDEGLYAQGQAFFHIVAEGGAAYGSRMFAGKALVLSTDRHGNSIGATVPLGTLLRRVVWAPTDEGEKEAERLLSECGVIAFESAEEMMEFMRNKGGM